MIALHCIGYFGPVTLLMLIVVLLRRSVSLTLYKEILLWEIGNILLNRTLKNLIRQDRPPNQVNILKLDLIDAREFGMPSGHCQQIGAAIYIIFSLTKSKGILTLAIIQSIATTIQRILTRKHTPNQVAVGLTIGICYSYMWNGRILGWKLQRFS